MDLIRIGEKIISRKKLMERIGQILEGRSRGLSQQEIASRLGVDRSFISRLESLGEVRRGKRIGVVGFPVANKEEIEAMLREEGVEFILLMSDQERWDFVRQKSGLELLNEIFDIIARLRELDVVVVIGSDYRIRVSEALLGREVVGWELGPSPIEGDRQVEVESLRRLIRHLIAKG